MIIFDKQNLLYGRIVCLFAFFMLSVNFKVFSQDAGTDENPKKNPYELISDYYKSWRSPFTKGNGYVGFAFALQDDQLSNVPRLLDRVLEGDQLQYDLTFKGGYFIGNYTLVGINVNYSRETFNGTIIDQNSDSLYRQSIDVTAIVTPNLKIYYPLVPTERLSFFTEIGAGLGGSSGLRTDTKNQDEINRVYIDEFIFNAGLSAGVVFFAIENFAFEVELNNLIGYEFRKVDSNVNSVPQSRVISNDVNFRINLLQLRLGLAYYIRSKR